MKKFLHFLPVIVAIIFVQACTERMICPAYQSAFIHDKKALEQRFSYFGEDSMPKVLEASKDRFLIVEPVSYRRKLRSLQTIPMTDVYPEVEDSVALEDDFYLAERDLDEIETVDSTGVSQGDSVYVISLKKEKFNVDQELYLWYLKDYLVYPDVRLIQENSFKESAETKEKKGFFRRLFGKKDREKAGTEIDSLDDLSENPEKEKKGFFHFLKKKKKNEEELTAPEEEEPKEEKEDPNTDPSTLPGG